jgi:hypothetical protein
MSDMADPGAFLLTAAEREAAVAALTVHRQAGRLDSSQFEDRQVRASAARTWADLDPLFADLPAPHPQRPVPVVVPPSGSARTGGIAWGPGLTAALPIIAVILFFLTKNWLVFLLVPLIMIFIKGPGRRR